MEKQIIQIVKRIESNKFLCKMLPFLKKLRKVLQRTKHYFQNVQIDFEKRKTDKLLSKI